MKILHATKKYLDVIGGDTIVTSNLLKQQEGAGHKTFILTSNCNNIKDRKNLMKFGFNISKYDLDKINLKRIFSLIRLVFFSFFYLKIIKPDIIHSHSSDIGFALSFASRIYRIPMINTCHGVSFGDTQYSFFKRKIELFFLKNSGFKKIITVDPNSLSSFKKYNFNNSIYLPNGVDLEIFMDKSKNNGRILKIIFIGRLEQQKGLVYLINAIKKIIKRKNNFQLLIIGTGSLENKLKKMVSDYKLNDYIVFLGAKDNKDLAEYYAKSDIFVLPSIWEGFPLTILEAWATKLPIITTNVGGMSKICTNLKDALIIPPKDSDKLADSLIKLIADSKLRARLGKEGRRLVEDKYNWALISKQLDSLYLEVMKK